MNQRGDPKRDSRKGKFLSDEVGRNSGTPIRGQYDRDLLYFGTQKDVRLLRTIPRQGQEYSREPVRIPPERHKYGDTVSRLEGRTDQLYHGHTVGGQTRPQQKPKVFQSTVS